MIIYKATNKTNGKTYIGKTTKTLNERRQQHVAIAKKRASFHFHKALQKWGEDAFDWEELFRTEDEKELNEKEVFFIEQYDTFKSGYNQTKGGEGQLGWVPSEETRKLWSEQRKGRNQYTSGYIHPKSKKLWSEERKDKERVEAEERRLAANKKRSEKQKGRVPWNKGKKTGPISEEHARKMQDSRRKSGFVKVIDVFLENGELYAQYNSQTALKKDLRIDFKTIRKYIDTETVYKGYILRTQQWQNKN